MRRAAGLRKTPGTRSWEQLRKAGERPNPSGHHKVAAARAVTMLTRAHHRRCRKPVGDVPGGPG